MELHLWATAYRFLLDTA